MSENRLESNAGCGMPGSRITIYSREAIDNR